MFCEECGFDMPEGATFCPVCNAPVNNQNQDNLIKYDNMQSDNVNQKSSNINNVITPPKKPFKWWIPLSCVLGAVLVGGGILIGIKIANKDKNDNTTEITEEITTEEQVATPTEAITEAIEETTEEITTEEAPPERVEVTLSEIPEWENLDRLLRSYYEKTEFDYQNIPDDFELEIISGIQIVDTSIAPNYNEDYSSEQYSDPMGKFEYGYAKIDIDGILWIEKNIFNLSDDDIERIHISDSDYIYETDGYYYFDRNVERFLGGFGVEHEYIKAQYDGKYYYITVDSYDSYDYMQNGDSLSGLSPTGRYEYKVELKTVDGVTFWSLYNCHSLTADWAKAYYDYIEENFGEWIDNAYIFYLDDDDIPEVLVDGGAYAPAYYDLLSYQNGNIVKVENIYNGYDSSYIEKGNIFYSECETLSDKINSLYKIENGEFIEIGNEVTNLSDGSVTYTWNGQNVSEDEYNKNFSENYDSNRAIQNTTGIQDIYSWLVWQSDEYSIPEWAKAYYDYLMDEQYNLQYGRLYEAYVIYVDNDDIPELFISWDSGSVYGQLLSYQNGNVVSSGTHSHFSINYIEKSNMFYAYGGATPVWWESLYKIENNDFFVIGEKVEAYDISGYSDISDITYTWNEQEISEDEYNRLLSEAFDISQATEIPTMMEQDTLNKVDNIYGWLMGQFE